MAEVEGRMEGEEEKLVEGMAMLDFDMLCATVVLQTRGISTEKSGKQGDEGEEEEEEGGDFGGVQRMWEGGILDCFEDRRIAIEAACCPCYRFSKNMRRANQGPCCLQGTMYLFLLVAILVNIIAFGITRRRPFLYMGIAFIISFGTYLGFFRSRIKQQFNIRGRDSLLDDCVNHLICPCCTLSQESRTLEMNNVQDGVWHGRGATICIGSTGEGSKAFAALHDSTTPTKSPELYTMQRESNGGDHLWNGNASHSEPLVLPSQSDS